MKSWELVNLVHSADIRPPSAKLLLSIVAAGTSSQTGVHVSSMDRLARLAGIGEREARRIVSRLRADGVLQVTANQCAITERGLVTTGTDLLEWVRAKAVPPGYKCRPATRRSKAGSA